MKLDKQQLEAPLGETFYKGNLGSMKQSDWRKYRIIKVTQGESVWYEIQNTMCSGNISFLPKFLGGFGVFTMYSEMFWAKWDGDKTVYDTHEEAKTLVACAIKWLDDLYIRLDQDEQHKKEVIISSHPE